MGGQMDGRRVARPRQGSPAPLPGSGPAQRAAHQPRQPTHPTRAAAPQRARLGDAPRLGLVYQLLLDQLGLRVQGRRRTLEGRAGESWQPADTLARALQLLVNQLGPQTGGGPGAEANRRGSAAGARGPLQASAQHGRAPASPHATATRARRPP